LGPWELYNLGAVALRLVSAVKLFPAAADTVVSATYVPELVHASLDLLIDGEQGVWHLANQGEITWAELARRSATMAGLDSSLVEECEISTLGLIASRPAYSVLGSERGQLLPPLDESLHRYIRERTYTL
jgi:dTDP-4-dehydrorhamnose reductase